MIKKKSSKRNDLVQQVFIIIFMLDSYTVGDFQYTDNYVISATRF